ncbi:EthD family reductase [Sinisalibacter aestuarii]|uniref:EthD domain-containing protein n=1 Tax=Sinisalibacter aestuarii TaxID=2949426 RepID=A0ABQ5LPZ3_9RHOB|nr:EthD family reductase [Sinisalibacter aestuarii]GKY87074.1 hypothetical protein STA1M1_09430 [Sinisalibacter aestuarii]
MISRFGLLKRSHEMSLEDFNRHWQEVHGPLASAMPGLREYFQHAVIARGDHAIRGPWELDGMSELKFDDLESMSASVAASENKAALADLPGFLSELNLVVCEKHEVIAPGDIGEGAVKQMSLIRRRPGLSDEAFRHEWLEVHAKIVRQWPNVLGYSQNLVIDRYKDRDPQSVSQEELPVDGIVEIWFASGEKRAEAYRSQIVLDTMAHAREFLSEITPFLVTTRRIV